MRLDIIEIKTGKIYLTHEIYAGPGVTQRLDAIKKQLCPKFDPKHWLIKVTL